MGLPFCVVHHLGTISYQQAWALQNELAAEIAVSARAPTLLLLEHPHTYTFGRRGQAENLLWDEAELARRGASVHWVDRGGDVTYHGPGQLVGYPLLPLGMVNLRPNGETARLPQADYVGYIRKLELVLITALASLGLHSGQVSGLTGVWVPGTPPDPKETSSTQTPSSDEPEFIDPQVHSAKIAAIGVKVDAKGVSRHGFALNVNPDMAYWEGIIGCGLWGYRITSLAEWLNPVPAMEVVATAVIAAFGKVFGYEMQIERPIT